MHTVCTKGQFCAYCMHWLANEACSPSFSLVSKGVEQFILQKPHKTFCQEFRRSASDAATMIMCL